MDSEVVLRVSDLARGGAGVSKDESGRVVFIPFTAPGDLVRVRIIEVHKRYAHAELLEVLEASAKRQTPPCPAFGVCGGCQWQHLSYDLQWETKFKGVLQTLSRAKVPVPELCDQIPAERIWEYRNRIQLHGESAKKQGGEKDVLGFFKAKSRELVPLNRCDIARPELNQIWEEVRAEGRLRTGSTYKVEVEVTPAGEILKAWDLPHAASGFRQVHDEQNEKLQNWISQALQPSDLLFDLFGGSGNLSLPLASKMKEIHCIDLSAPAQRETSHPNHIHFHQESVVKWLLKRAKKPRSHTQASAILDPPREGLGASFSEIASGLEKLGVKEIVAVGCDADAWARDLGQWVSRGWKLQRMAVIDLFPQTTHVESIGLISL